MCQMHVREMMQRPRTPETLRIHVHLRRNFSEHHQQQQRAAMVGPGVNLAITKDGGAYNKLQRPADYLALTTNAPQKDAPTIGGISPTSASKRKREDEDDTSIQKRTRASLDRTGRQTPRNGSGEKGKPRAAENGMRALLPGLDDDGGSSDEGSMSEALAYLRNVR